MFSVYGSGKYGQRVQIISTENCKQVNKSITTTYLNLVPISHSKEYDQLIFVTHFVKACLNTLVGIVDVFYFFSLPLYEEQCPLHFLAKL